MPPAHQPVASRGLLADLEGEPLFDRATDPASDAGHLMQRVALGRTVVLAPESVRGYLRRDLACVPVLDAPPVTVVLAWPEESRSPAVAALVRAAAAVAGAGVNGEPPVDGARGPAERPESEPGKHWTRPPRVR